MQRPEEYWCPTQAQDPGPPPSLSHQHLASVRFLCGSAVGASGKPGPQAPVEEVPFCPSIPRRFWRPHSQLGNSETKVPASNCLLSKAQPASSATGVRGKLMSWWGERGGAALHEACATLANRQTGSSPLADGHCHPPSPSAPRLSARFSSGSCLPSPGQCGAFWVQLGRRLMMLGVPFPWLGLTLPVCTIGALD